MLKKELFNFWNKVSGIWNIFGFGGFEVVVVRHKMPLFVTRR